MCRKLFTHLSACFVATALIATTLSSSGQNLLPNGSFERDRDGNGVADGWTSEINNGAKGQFDLSRDAKDGRFSQHIVHANASDQWVRTSASNMRARPDCPYRLSGWVKATGPWAVYLYEFPGHQGNNSYNTNVVAQGGPSGWIRIGKTIRTGPDATRFKLSLVTNGAGEAWFDGFELRDLMAIPVLLIPTLPAAPAVDGSLTDKCWADAAQVDGFVDLGGEGKPGTPHTAVRVGYRGNTLLSLIHI